MTRLNWGMLAAVTAARSVRRTGLGLGLMGLFLLWLALWITTQRRGALLHKAWALQRTGPMGIGVKCWLARPNAVTGLIW